MHTNLTQYEISVSVARHEVDEGTKIKCTCVPANLVTVRLVWLPVGLMLQLQLLIINIRYRTHRVTDAAGVLYSLHDMILITYDRSLMNCE